MATVLNLQAETVEFVDDTRGSDVSLWSCDSQGSGYSLFAC